MEEVDLCTFMESALGQGLTRVMIPTFERFGAECVGNARTVIRGFWIVFDPFAS